MVDRFFTVVMMLGGVAAPGLSAPITTLHSTGQGTVGKIDPHYRITQRALV